MQPLSLADVVVRIDAIIVSLRRSFRDGWMELNYTYEHEEG